MPIPPEKMNMMVALLTEAATDWHFSYRGILNTVVENAGNLEVEVEVKGSRLSLDDAVRRAKEADDLRVYTDWPRVPFLFQRESVIYQDEARQLVYARIHIVGRR